MTRNEAREYMMQILYEMDAAKSMDHETAERLTDERLSGNHKKRGRDLICSIIDNLDEIDASINRSSRSWSTSRMPKVDLAVMRLAIGEMMYSGSDNLPQAVAINEAIDLAKKYSTERSSRFIHGVLGAVVRSNE